jgi:hypothetical protein
MDEEVKKKSHKKMLHQFLNKFNSKKLNGL